MTWGAGAGSAQARALTSLGRTSEFQPHDPAGSIGTFGSMDYDGRRPRIPVALTERIDGARGQVPFNRWVVRALEAALGEPSGLAREKPGTPGVGGVSPARGSASPRTSKSLKDVDPILKQLPLTYRCRVVGCDRIKHATSPKARCPVHNESVVPE